MPFPRVQEIVLPILRAGFPEFEPHQIGSWVADIDYRVFPIINIRRLEGRRSEDLPKLLSSPVVELTVYSDEDIESAERLYEDVLDVLFDAVRNQTQTPKGYIRYVKERMGAQQFSSLFMDSWRVQGILELGIRPPRST